MSPSAFVQNDVMSVRYTSAPTPKQMAQSFGFHWRPTTAAALVVRRKSPPSASLSLFVALFWRWFSQSRRLTHCPWRCPPAIWIKWLSTMPAFSSGIRRIGVNNGRLSVPSKINRSPERGSFSQPQRSRMEPSIGQNATSGAATGVIAAVISQRFQRSSAFG